jgi:hypothetical protein
MMANRVWLNDGSGTFADSGQALGATDTTSVALGDLDGDGDLDLVDGNVGAQGNRVWTNDGTGQFTDSLQTLDTGSTWEIALGDLDDDGDLDMVAGNVGGANRVWTNDGAGTFSDSGQALGSSNTEGVAVGDADGDGDLDVVAGNAAQANRVYRNNSVVPNSPPTVPTGLSAQVDESPQPLTGSLTFVEGLAQVRGSGTSFATEVSSGDMIRLDADVNLCGVATVEDDLNLTLSRAYAQPGVGIAEVYTGPNGVCDTTAAGDDVQVIPVGSGAPGTLAIEPGLNVVLDTVPAGDDTVSGSDILTGPNGVCDTTAAGDDVQIIPLSQGEPHALAIGPGVNAVLDSVHAGDDLLGASGAGSVAGRLTFSWGASIDDHTPSSGLSYNLRVGTAPGLSDVFPCHADPLTGWRRMPALGNVGHQLAWALDIYSAGTYHWSVQAIDTSFAGSAWATEETVNVP